MSGTPKLSVAIVTYNHENFIAKALDSVLMQRVSFDYEILVGDDFSTDRTREILRDYERRWPGKVKPVFRDGNIGTMRNVKDIFEKCRGQYMALLAGDDYWTDPDKLQVQVDYLDRHPDCSFCHHEVDYISSADGRKIRDYPPRRYRIERPDPHDLSLINYVQAIAIVLRREYLPPFDDRFLELKIEDWPLVVLLSQRGWIGYLDRNMAHYRIHSSNNWANRPPDYKIRAMEKMGRYLLETVDTGSRDAWKNMLLALAFKDLALAVKSLSPGRAVACLRNFLRYSAEFRKPFWVLNSLWPYFRANYAK